MEVCSFVAEVGDSLLVESTQCGISGMLAFTVIGLVAATVWWEVKSVVDACAGAWSHLAAAVDTVSEAGQALGPCDTGV